MTVPGRRVTESLPALDPGNATGAVARDGYVGWSLGGRLRRGHRSAFSGAESSPGALVVAQSGQIWPRSSRVGLGRAREGVGFPRHCRPHIDCGSTDAVLEVLRVPGILAPG